MTEQQLPQAEKVETVSCGCIIRTNLNINRVLIVRCNRHANMHIHFATFRGVEHYLELIAEYDKTHVGPKHDYPRPLQFGQCDKCGKMCGGKTALKEHKVEVHSY